MKYVASCSCGKDSLAMVLTLIEKKYPLDYVIFVDLGKEFKSIYDTWERLTQILDDNSIKYKRLELMHSFDYYFSDHEVKTKDGSYKCGYSWCGGCTRWGTTLKNQLIKNFYRQTFDNEPICEYVGIASDETDRIQIKRDKNIKIYPLVYWGMSENDCLVKCYKSGFTYLEDNNVQLYQVLDRVSCYCCGNKNLKELKAIYKYLPKYWERLKEMQERTQKPFRQDKTIFDLEIRFKTKQQIKFQ